MTSKRYSSWMLERLAIGETVRLRIGKSTIGRHSSSNIRVLDAGFVSRHHAIFEVTDNDESVKVTDVSSNGLFVNERRYDKSVAELKDNDLIGFGVLPVNLDDDVDVTGLPIYTLKYAPIRPFQNLNVPKLLSTPTSSSKPAVEVNGSINSNAKINKTETKNENRDDEKPCSSTTVKKEILFVSTDEILEISDDDDENDVLEKADLKSNEMHKDFVQSLNQQIDAAINNKLPTENNDKINPSQKSQENLTNGTLNENIITAPAETAHIEHSKAKEENDSYTQQSKEPVLHIPIISEIKKEHIRTVSNDIKNIFGDIDDDIEMQKTIKQINPFVYNEISDSKNIKLLDEQEKLLTNGATINLTDDEEWDDAEEEVYGVIIPNVIETEEKNIAIKDECKKEMEIDKLSTNNSNSTVPTTEDPITLVQPKSPNLFDSSLDTSKEEANAVENNYKDNQTANITDNIELDEYNKYVPHSDDEDVEDLMFSQVIINDMKAELRDDLSSKEILPIDNLMDNNRMQPSVEIAGTTVTIKQEPGLELFAPVPKELENSCWTISDDEDSDNELASKVNDWSNKIFSQNLSLMSQNMSQVYELAESDKNEDNYEDDDWEDDNLCLLEDDLDGIAEIYNSIDEKFTDKTTKAINDVVTVQPVDDLSIKSSKEFTEKSEIKDNKINEENLSGDEISNKNEEQVDSIALECKKDIEVKLETFNEIKDEEKEPINETNNCTIEAESPIIRKRRLSRANRLSESSSSSENELDKKDSKLTNNIIIPDKPIPKIRPLVIDAPSLPKHRGKLRGVSADSSKNRKLNSNSSLKKELNTVREKIIQERKVIDLKRKWIEKPSVSKKREKEQKKVIQERRKDKLKELAERKNSTTKDSGKRKLTTEGNEQKAKVAKVKVTTHNRGAFLANNEPTPPPTPAAAQHHKAEQKPQFKIPKVSQKAEEIKKPHNEPQNSKEPPTRSHSMDSFETFSEQISKPDELLLQRQNVDPKSQSNNKTKPVPLRRHSVVDTTSKQPNQTILKRQKTPPPLSNRISKESVAKRAIRTTNKITFASMEKNITETEENKRKLNELNTAPLKSINKATTNTTETIVKKKTVRFNDTPIVHYIERITGACKKIIEKDIRTCITTYANRRHLVRAEYTIIDNSNKIISDILTWSNEWFKRRNAEADAAGDVIFPMPTQFTSFEHYKSIILPLLKLEFVSTLEREFNETRHIKTFKVSFVRATPNDCRITLETRFFNNHNKEVMDSSSYDLVLLESDKRGPQIFAYVISNRKAPGSFATILYEVIAKNFTIEYFNAIKEFTVRPVMDRVRVHFGAFNSVYQLQSTPLFEKIINPLELLNCRPPPKKKVSYLGFDPLNEKQKQVLLNTYVKIMDETVPNITLIQGPPGTGKSLVITNLALQCLYGLDVRYLDKKILICAQSNAAVDVIALKLFDISMRMRMEKRFRLVRYGMLNKIHPTVQPISLQKLVERDQLRKLKARNNNLDLENKENLKQQILQFEAQIAEMSARNVTGTVEEDVLIEKKRQLQLMRNVLNQSMRPEDERSLYSWYLTNANIICATLSSCVNLSQYIDYFDVCIIDEATQCIEPFTLLPLKFGINSLVLVGDTQQLPATVLSKKANELGLGTSMFTRIQRCLDNIPSTNVKGVTTPNNIIYSLQTQYRMHPEICRWPNQYFYRNELINAKETTDFNKSPLVPFCILSLAYTQNSSGFNGKITNNLEAEFVAKLLKALDGFIPNTYNSYGVITPYAHHRATLESAIRVLGLTNIMVNTIDSYQGLEKDVIVISNARTNGIGFLSNPQRLNVALTRAKKCLILCGNFRNLESVPAWRCLLENARERKVYLEIGANCIEDIQSNVIDKIKLINQK